MCCVLGYAGHDLSKEKFTELLCVLLPAGRMTSVWQKLSLACWALAVWPLWV